MSVTYSKEMRKSAKESGKCLCTIAVGNSNYQGPMDPLAANFLWRAFCQIWNLMSDQPKIFDDPLLKDLPPKLAETLEDIKYMLTAEKASGFQIHGTADQYLAVLDALKIYTMILKQRLEDSKRVQDLKQAKMEG